MIKKNTKLGALRGLALAGAIGACSVVVSQGAVITSISGGGDARVMSALNSNTAGPFTESGYTWTSTNSNAVYGWTSGYVMNGNGDWDSGLGFPFAGTNSGTDSMTIAFDSDVSAVLAFINYAQIGGTPVGGPTPTIEIFDSGNALLESYNLAINTGAVNNSGEDRGFERVQGDIRSIRFTNAYIVAANIRTSSAAVPEPSSLALLGLGGLLLARRRRA